MRRKVLELLSHKRSRKYDRPVIQINAEELVNSMISSGKPQREYSLEFIAGIRNYAAAIVP